MPGMVYASIERPPVMGSTLKSVDDAAAKQVKGVQQVVQTRPSPSRRTGSKLSAARP